MHRPLKKEDLQMVVLDCPYDSIGSAETQRLLAKTLALKIEGYLQAYDYGVLPTDTTDLIGTHLLVCRKTAGGWQPLTGIKSTTLTRAKTHGLVFPGLGLVTSAKAPAHERVVREVMARCEREQKQLAYTSGWTMDPSVKNDPESRALLKEMFEAMYVFHHLESGIDEILIGGTLRFKTERLFQLWGHDPLQADGEELPPIIVPHLLNERVTVMHLKEFTAEAITRAQNWRFHWNRRVLIASEKSSSNLHEESPLWTQAVSFTRAKGKSR